MGTISEQLQSIINSKSAIKTAIENKGVSNVGEVLEDYAEKINEIPVMEDAPSDSKKYVRQNANWVEETTYDLSGLATKDELNGKADVNHTHSEYLPLSGGKITGNLIISGNIGLRDDSLIRIDAVEEDNVSTLAGNKDNNTTIAFYTLNNTNLLHIDASGNTYKIYDERNFISGTDYVEPSTLSNYVTTTALSSQLATKANISHTHTSSQVSGLATVATSGSYDDLTDKPTIPSLTEYATQTWVTDQGYLTSIPSEYITETELNAKGYQTAAQVETAISKLVDSAPEALNTLNELAAALGDDPNFATTVTNMVAEKADLNHTHTVANITNFGSIKFTGASTGTFSGTNDLTINIPSPTTSLAWSAITGKPSTFTPSSHTHTAAQVTGLADVATSGSYTDLSNKPTIPSLSGYATQSWVNTQLGSYLPKSGGTMSGKIIFGLGTSDGIGWNSSSLSGKTYLWYDNESDRGMVLGNSTDTLTLHTNGDLNLYHQVAGGSKYTIWDQNLLPVRKTLKDKSFNSPGTPGWIRLCKTYTTTSSAIIFLYNNYGSISPKPLILAFTGDYGSSNGGGNLQILCSNHNDATNYSTAVWTQFRIISGSNESDPKNLVYIEGYLSSSIQNNVMRISLLSNGYQDIDLVGEAVPEDLSEELTGYNTRVFNSNDIVLVDKRTLNLTIDNYLLKSGDTLTGNLNIRNANNTIGFNTDHIEIETYDAEINIVNSNSNTNMHVNYRGSALGGTVPTNWYWRAGTSSNFANGYWGNLYMSGNLVATQTWTNSQLSGKAAASHTHPLSGISDLHSSWDAILKAAPTTHVTSYPSISNVTGKQNLVIKLNSGTTEGTNLFTYNATAAKTVNITASSIGAAASSHTHPLSGISDLHSNWDSILKAAPTIYVTRHPTISEVTSKQNLVIKLNGGSTEGTNKFTYNATGAKTVNITPSAIGAAASSHGTHVSFSSTAPVAPGTASAGSASTVARSDHRHPLQTSVAKLTTARTVTFNGDATGSFSFDGAANKTCTLDVTNSTKWNGKSLAIVSKLPSSPDSNTIYFITD